MTDDGFRELSSCDTGSCSALRTCSAAPPTRPKSADVVVPLKMIAPPGPP